MEKLIIELNDDEVSLAKEVMDGLDLNLSKYAKTILIEHLIKDKNMLG